LGKALIQNFENNLDQIGFLDETLQSILINIDLLDALNDTVEEHLNLLFLYYSLAINES
jgi:hypothetical protein